VSARSVKLAVLGAGYWGTKLSKEYAGIETTTGDARLSYVIDSSQQALERVRKEIGQVYPSNSARYSSSLGEVLDNPEIEAVHIALPNQFHYDIGRQALEAGKHVLIEKPVALTSREAFKLARLSEEKGLVLQVGHVFRFNNAVRTVRELIRSRRLGKMYYANLSWATYMKPLPRDRDIVFDLAPHPVDILNHLLEEWPISVDAIGDSFVQGRENCEEVATVNLEFPDRILAHLYLSWIDHGAKERTIRVICEKGTVTCDALAQKVKLDQDNTSVEIPIFPSDPRSMMANMGSPDFQWKELTGPNNTIRDMQLHFVSLIRERGPQLSSALVGARTVQVLEDITAAIRRRGGRSRMVFPELTNGSPAR